MKYIGALLIFSSLTATSYAKSNNGVSFGNLKDGQSVQSPVKVLMQVNGMTVHPAGEIKEGTGHHHIVVDGKAIPEGTVVPTDKTHLHFGKGQTETEVTLSPGPHKLTLQFADGAHRSYGPKWSKTISINVKN